jgi:hypothetical protein
MDAKQTRNPADRAVACIRAAAGRQPCCLGDEDPATFETAAMALGAIGPFAVGPLTAALPKGPSPRHRVAIVGTVGNRIDSPTSPTDSAWGQDRGIFG